MLVAIERLVLCSEETPKAGGLQSLVVSLVGAASGTLVRFSQLVCYCAACIVITVVSQEIWLCNFHRLFRLVLC